MTTSKSNTHAYVRPTSLRTEHNDDIPKPWMGIGANGNKFGTVVGTNNVNYNNYNSNFEMESLTGGLPSSASAAAAAAAAGVGSTSGSLSGWYYPTKMDGIFALWNIIVSLITQSISSMGENKTRCYILLFLTVVAECYATALSKQAKEIGSAPLFFWSCFVNFFCMVGFNICLAHIEVSVAYAIWSAFGTLLVAVVGIVLFNESYDLTKIICLGLITAGVIGLNLRDSDHHH